MPLELPSGYSGAALVARGEEVLFAAAGGIADPATGRECAVDTPFNFASLGKMFVASTVVSLGVELDAPVAPLVPDLAGAVGGATLRQLLSHTSGMGDVFDLPEFEARRTEFRALADWLPLIASTRPERAPGGGWRYSNAGFLAAAVVLERLTGSSWESLLRERVFAPAGMSATGYPPLVGRDAPPRLAVPWSAELGRDTRDLHVVRGMPAGGGVTTVGDLHRFAVWLQQQPWHQSLLEPVAPTVDHPRPGYGLGFFLDGQLAGHDGAFWGISAELQIDRHTGLIVAALANADPPMANDAAEALLAAAR